MGVKLRGVAIVGLLYGLAQPTPNFAQTVSALRQEGVLVISNSDSLKTLANNPHCQVLENSSAQFAMFAVFCKGIGEEVEEFALKTPFPQDDRVAMLIFGVGVAFQGLSSATHWLVTHPQNLPKVEFILPNLYDSIRRLGLNKPFWTPISDAIERRQLAVFHQEREVVKHGNGEVVPILIPEQAKVDTANTLTPKQAEMKELLRGVAVDSKIKEELLKIVEVSSLKGKKATTLVEAINKARGEQLRTIEQDIEMEIAEPKRAALREKMAQLNNLTEYQQKTLKKLIDTIRFVSLENLGVRVKALKKISTLPKLTPVQKWVLCNKLINGSDDSALRLAVYILKDGVSIKALEGIVARYAVNGSRRK